MFCHHCGSQIGDDAAACIHCGVAMPLRQAPPTPLGGLRLDPLERALFPDQGRSWVVALLLCLFFPALGIHRFYLGKWFTGLLLLFPFGGMGIWWLIDLIRILLGSLNDAAGRPLVR